MVLKARSGAEGPAGLYIHIPFCRRRCPFCDFAITTDLRNVEAYLNALEKEIDLRAASWRIPFDTVYLGGGTPSVLGPEAIGRILKGARSRFDVTGDAEVTVEANPGNLGPGDFGRLLESGVNRLSLGIQSFRDDELALLGRDHSAGDSLEAFGLARREGFGNISIDLLYGIPGSSEKNWAETIERALELGPDHISAYQLTHEPGTPMSRKVEKKSCQALSDGEAQELFLFTRERLLEAGYLHYEISSYPRSLDLESRHNRKYWEGAPYLGLGPSAHSHRDPLRSWNIPRLPAYVEALRSGRDPAEGEEHLGADERRLERLFLGLRTARGLDLENFEADFGIDLRSTHRTILETLSREGLSSIEAGRLILTPRGLALADGIALGLSR